MSAADYLSSTTNSLLKSGGGGMAFDWATFGGFGLGAIGNIVGGIFQGQANSVLLKSKPMLPTLLR